VITSYFLIFHSNLFSSKLVKQTPISKITQDNISKSPKTISKTPNPNLNAPVSPKIYNKIKKSTSTPSTIKQKARTYQYTNIALSQLLNTKKSLKCTISSTSGKTKKVTGIVYTNGNMLRSTLSTIEKNPENTNEIIKNGTIYVWSSSGQGLTFKMPLSEMKSRLSPLYEAKNNYNCENWIPNSNVFILPNLQFNYIDQILAQAAAPQYITVSPDETLRQIFSGEAVECTFTDNSKAPEVITNISIYGNNGNIRENYSTTTKTDKTISMYPKYMMYTKNTLYEWNYNLVQENSMTPSQFDQISSIFYNHQDISNFKCKKDEIGAQSFLLPEQMPVVKEVSKFTIF